MPSIRSATAVFVALAASACAHVPHGAGADEVPRGRLPSGVRPLAYAIELAIDPDEPRLAGTERVHLLLDRPTRGFFLHGRDLAVSEIFLRARGATYRATYREVSEDGVARVEVERELPAGIAELFVTWDAPIAQKSMDGAFRVEADGTGYVFSQHEATLGRRVFPGFDEPSFKTPFALSLVVPEADVALANTMPDEGAAKDAPRLPNMPGTKRVQFATTAPIPTYLLAFAVGPFDVVRRPDIPPSGARGTPIPLRGVAVKGRGPSLTWALERTPDAVRALEQYFEMPYPFAKIDLAAIPGFVGAMENVGLLTFNEGVLATNGHRAPILHQELSADTLTHELAHQWTGNLATMPWWDDLWLNEAFAMWLEKKAGAVWAPELDSELRGIEEAQGTMDLDSLVATRSVTQPVLTHDDIMNAFDDITYRKGGALVAMFEGWLGEQRFQKGVRGWLEGHAYGSASTKDLLAALSAAAGEDLSPAFSSFLTQPGLPLLHVALECKNGNGVAVVTQERELPRGSRGDRTGKWLVPWCYARPAKEEVERRCVLVRPGREEVPLGEGCPAWILPNSQAQGYYRFDLAPSAWAPLVRAKELGTRDVLAIADSLRSAFQNGRLPAAEALPLLAELAASSERSVAVAPRPALELVRDRLLPPELAPKAEAWIRALYRPALRSTVPTLADHGAGYMGGRQRAFRAALFSILAELGRDPDVRRALADAGRAYVGLGGPGDRRLHPEAVDADLVETAVSVALEESSEEMLELVLQHLKTEVRTDIRSDLVSALGDVRDPKLGPRVRALALELPEEETLTLLDHQASHPATSEATWQWLVEHLDELLPKISEEFQVLIAALPRHLCDARHLEELRGPIGQRLAGLPGGPRAIAGAIESIELCVARVDAQAPGTRAFFERLP